jgi:serine phosphatase RsbU (regulator of sigma subunit)
LIVRSTGAVESVDGGGPPLGILSMAAYRQECNTLGHGDLIVLYSDGVTEAAREGEDYGADRLRELVERKAAVGAAALGEAILDDLHAFLGDEEPSDDVTIVVVKVRS